MVEVDFCNNGELSNIIKKHLRWVGLSESAQDVLAVLIVENYCTGKALSPEEICSITGFARSSISVIISQLEVLGFIVGRLDTEQKRQGRKRTLFHVTGGISGLALFGLRRLVVELKDLLDEIEAIKVGVASDNEASIRLLSVLEEESAINLEHLEKCSRWIKSSKALFDLDAVPALNESNK